MAILKLLHVLLAFGLVAGVIGRGVLLRAAARTDDVEMAYRLSEAAGQFERLAVWGSLAVPAAGLATAWAQGYAWLGLTTGWMLTSVVLLLSIFVLVPLVFLPRGRVFAAEMAAARAAGTVTERLRAAFGDRAVAAARWYEVAVVAVIVALMVLKPF
jgi:Predicted integral membrane protein (DUF2269)